MRRAPHQELARAARLARTGAAASLAIVRIRGGRGLKIIDVVVTLVSAERALVFKPALLAVQIPAVERTERRPFVVVVTRHRARLRRS